MKRSTLRVLLLASSIVSLYSCGSSSAGASNSAATTATAPAEEKKIQVGQVLKTEYFDVTVNSVKIVESMKIDIIQELKKEEGSKYLIIDLSLKNTDKESRMMFDGEVHITYNGKEYKFEQPETIMSEGWGILMDNINPLVTKKTKLAYKIPTEIQGPAYYLPARSGEDEKIFLGDIK